MSYFVVTFEAYAASANGRRLNPRELSEWTAKGFSETSRDEGTFPDGVVAVLCGSMGNTGKTFPDSKTQEHLVEIKLVVQADTLDAAEAFAAPPRLLATLTDLISTKLHLQGDWRLIDAETLDDYGATPESIGLTSGRVPTQSS